MRIVYMGNNWLGFQILRWLKAEGENIISLFVHPIERANYREEMINIAELPGELVFEGHQVNEPEVIMRLKELAPSIILCVLFGYVLKSEILSIPEMGCINLHPSFLPYNRGYYPNVWSIIEDTSAGATLHFMDDGIDTGDIIAQKEVSVEYVDTGKTLYHKIEQAAFELFRETWPAIKSGTNARILQPSGGTYHKRIDVRKIDKIDLFEKYRAIDLINVLRARTFPPYDSAYFEIDGKKVFLELKLKARETE